MKNLTIVLCVIMAVTIMAEPSYIVLNAFAETISSGEWTGPPHNNIVTVGSMPNQVIAEDPDHIWVVASGENKVQRLTVSGASATIAEEFALPAGSNPYLMCRIGDTVYTTLWVSGGLGIIDINSGAVSNIPEFCLGPQGVFADSEFVFVTAGNLDPITFLYGDGELWRLRRDGTIIDNIEIGTNPQQIIPGPDGNLHIVCTGDYSDIEGAVYIIDPAAFAVVDSICVGGAPQRLALDPVTGIIYSAISRYESWVGVPGSGRIIAYDGLSHDIIWDADDSVNSIYGTGIIGLAADNNYIFVPSMDSSWLEIVRVEGAGLSPIATHTTGHGPLDISLFDPTSIFETELPTRIEIFAYPNPFNSAVKIRIRGIEGSRVRVEVFDVNGKRVRGIEDSRVQGGTPGADNRAPITEFIWTPDKSLGSGIYLVRAKIGGESVTKRVVYLK